MVTFEVLVIDILEGERWLLQKELYLKSISKCMVTVTHSSSLPGLSRGSP